MSTNTKIPAGKYLAKIIDYWVDKTNAGVPRVNISLNVIVDQSQTGVVNALRWDGSFATEKSKNNVLKTLEVCGLRSPSHIGLVAKGKDAGALDLHREVEVEVVHEQKTSKDGKSYLWVSIAWINPVGGGKFKDAMAADDFEVFVATSGLQGDFMKMAQEKGVKLDDRTYVDAPRSDDPFADIPF